MTRLHELRPNRGELVDALAVVGMCGVSLVAFQSSYGGVAFLVSSVTAAVIGVIVALFSRKAGWHVLVSVVLAVAVYVVACSVLALRPLTFAGFVPSPESILTSLEKAVTGWKELITTAPPVGYTGDLMAVPVFAGMASGFLAMTFALRTRVPALAIVPPFVVLGLAIATGTNEPVSVVVNGALFAAVAFGWLAWREHRRRPLLQGGGISARRLASCAVALAIAGGVGVVVAPRLLYADSNERAIWRQTVTPPFDPREYPSPLASYRYYAKAGELDPETGQRTGAPVMFTVQGLPAGIPVRLATMDAYDGLVWQVSTGDPAEPSLYDSGSFERVGASLTPDFDGDTADVVVEIGEYGDVWIPDVGEVISLRFTGSESGPSRDRELSDSFRYNRATDTGATPIRLQPGDRYEMTVRLPVMVEATKGLELIPDVERIGQAVAVGQVVEALNSPELSAMSSANERLDRVAELMTTTGAYSDGDDEHGQIQARAGHDARRLVDFAGDWPNTSMVGNAEQYAATYALLFRSLDRLPTRVVMGFMPSESSVDAPVEVHASEVDAWVEVPVEDLGWIAILPTPDRDQTEETTSQVVQPQPDYRTQNPPPPPLLDPEFDQPATAKGKAKTTVEDRPDEPAAAPDGPDGISELASNPAVIATAVAVSPFALLAVAGGLIVALKVLRRARRRRRGVPHQRIAAGWREVTDLATDMGRPVPAGVTRREAAQFASARATHLASATDAAVWGGDELTDQDVDQYWGELVDTLHAMRREVGFFGRLKASISLHSLWRRAPSDVPTRSIRRPPEASA